MYVVSTDPVFALRAELRRSLLRPSLVRRLWYLAGFRSDADGTADPDALARAGAPRRDAGGAGLARPLNLGPEGESQPIAGLAPDPTADE